LQKTYPELHLVLAGREDIFSKRLLFIASQLALPKESLLFFPNPTDTDLYELYAHAAVYVFPSLLEGFGLPPLEAMSQGVPVAASHSSCLPEILGDAAVYFSPTDPQDMARAITSLLQNPNLRRELIDRGLKHVSRYSWRTMAQTIKEGYATWLSQTI
jgi:glycosyltransferase involved in cell wall biosynthesis